jgi:dTDP-4-amino-4,6-dideoxygalactose transaminase
MADIEKLSAIANDHNIPLVEDCAQAHGAMINGKKAGSFGIIGCFSFYPTKNLGALGDGGAIVTSNSELAAKIKQLRQYGWQNKYDVTIPGGKNSRLDEMQAAILRVKLQYLDEQNQHRRNIARQYNQELTALPLILPNKLDNSYVAHLYVIRSENRDKISAYLLQQGIKTDIHYPIPDHKQEVLQQNYNNISLPETETACSQVLTLPCFAGMNDTEVNHVIEAVKQILEES